MYLPNPSLLSSCYFPGLLTKDLKVLWRVLSISRHVFIPITDISFNLCDQHSSACGKFVHKIFPDPTLPMHNNLSKCRSHNSTRSTFRSMPSRIKINRNSTIPYILHSRVLTGMRHHFCVQSSIQHNTMQCNATQSNKMQNNTIQHNATQYNTIKKLWMPRTVRNHEQFMCPTVKMGSEPGTNYFEPNVFPIILPATRG